MKKKNFIYPEKDHWLTQSEEWVNWTNEQRDEYLNKHFYQND